MLFLASSHVLREVCIDYGILVIHLAANYVCQHVIWMKRRKPQKQFDRSKKKTQNCSILCIGKKGSDYTGCSLCHMTETPSTKQDKRAASGWVQLETTAPTDRGDRNLVQRDNATIDPTQRPATAWWGGTLSKARTGFKPTAQALGPAPTKLQQLTTWQGRTISQSNNLLLGQIQNSSHFQDATNLIGSQITHNLPKIAKSQKSHTAKTEKASVFHSRVGTVQLR